VSKNVKPFHCIALDAWQLDQRRKRKISTTACTLICHQCLLTGMYFCYNKYEELENKGVDESIEWKFTTNLDSFTNSKKFWLAAGKNRLVFEKSPLKRSHCSKTAFFCNFRNTSFNRFRCSVSHHFGVKKTN
jgi:hypothetical protein